MLTLKFIPVLSYIKIYCLLRDTEISVRLRWLVGCLVHQYCPAGWHWLSCELIRYICILPTYRLPGGPLLVIPANDTTWVFNAAY